MIMSIAPSPAPRSCALPVLRAPGVNSGSNACCQAVMAARRRSPAACRTYGAVDELAHRDHRRSTERRHLFPVDGRGRNKAAAPAVTIQRLVRPARLGEHATASTDFTGRTDTIARSDVWADGMELELEAVTTPKFPAAAVHRRVGIFVAARTCRPSRDDIVGGRWSCRGSGSAPKPPPSVRPATPVSS